MARRDVRDVLCALAAASCVTAAAGAQEPQGPPPPSSSKSAAGSPPYELLPDIGQIGAQVGILGGASWNPYDVGRGVSGGAFLDLPLGRGPGGRLSYELVLGLSRAESEPFTITDPLAYVANLASGASRSAALAGPPFAPFPVTRAVRTRLRLLHVSPFGLKYALTGLDHVRLRPYAVAGVDVVVALTQQVPEADQSVEFAGTSPFDDPLIAGIVAQAPELTARGIPTGQGNIEMGLHLGTGFEIRLSHGLSLNLDYRFVVLEGNQSLQMVTSALGFHW